ncbi:MAG: YihY/virulence factor BrkB family protein, partial [Verrucomicrobiaceae bacterium]|nr:YihY/virulence factor BrkB family protein [Verrucomicrobiaceae bacterium]
MDVAPHPRAGWLDLVKKSAIAWNEDKALRLAAALAYYSVFSIGPLLVISLGVAGLVLGH